jgi:hypothetical protein
MFSFVDESRSQQENDVPDASLQMSGQLDWFGAEETKRQSVKVVIK